MTTARLSLVTPLCAFNIGSIECSTISSAAVLSIDPLGLQVPWEPSGLPLTNATGPHLKIFGSKVVAENEKKAGNGSWLPFEPPTCADNQSHTLVRCAKQHARLGVLETYQRRRIRCPLLPDSLTIVPRAAPERPFGAARAIAAITVRGVVQAHLVQ